MENTYYGYIKKQVNVQELGHVSVRSLKRSVWKQSAELQFSSNVFLFISKRTLN